MLHGLAAQLLQEQGTNRGPNYAVARLSTQSLTHLKRVDFESSQSATRAQWAKACWAHHAAPFCWTPLITTPVAVLAGDHKKLLSVKGVGEEGCKVLTHWSEHFDISREIRRMKGFIAQSDDAFPPLLKGYDPPISAKRIQY